MLGSMASGAAVGLFKDSGSPRKSTARLWPSSDGRWPVFVRGPKFFNHAHVSISVPPTPKCPSDSRRCSRACSSMVRNNYGPQQLTGNVRFQQDVFGLGEHRVTEAAIHDVQIQKPLEHEVVCKLRVDLPLTLHSKQRHEPTAIQQVLRGYRSPTV